MLKAYFGDLADGRIGRARFVGLWLGLIGMALLAALAIVVALGAAVHLAAGDLEEVEAAVVPAIGIPAIVVLTLAGFAFLFANLNIVAKRARDIGWPGWLVAVLYLVLSGGASQAGEGGHGGTAGLGLVMMLVLAIIPANLFRRTPPDGQSSGRTSVPSSPRAR
ncbi:hypothetical protein DLJ53_24060 [Acuticoccus sediminis]|uniref:DUF805 domain-containing protein n=1 Tax=Acuticoccus sediminis TaxID=2184697 RepID=A0A8B2NP74_9HYPH|nr:DUF805 domain-containing protein [Acuticoccus sediminis]RAH98720.1 hypothetical protein DLJ53_24060 [Acuticoccus sediminis]